MLKQHKEKIILSLIILSFLSIKIFHLLNQKGIFWDSAVYIGMGKYIFSAAKVGLWEPSRPLIWPIILGIIWKINLNPIIIGRILELVLSTACIYLTYLIGKEIFDENIALLSAFFLAFTPIFLFNSSTILTGIPSTFFALLTVYTIIKKRYFLTGLFLGLSFMTRFLQLLIVILIILFILKRKEPKKLIFIIYGVSIITIPYLILNTILYKNPLYPFILQLFMSKYTGWIFHQPLNFYFVSLFKENFLLIFSIVGTILILKQKDLKKALILSIFLLFFIFFNSIAHKELRFVITFLPYMYLVASYGIFRTINMIKKKKHLTLLIVSIISIVFLASITSQIKIPTYKEYPEFTDYLKTNNKSSIWISNPLFISQSNIKADELVYYPLYNSKKIENLKEKLPQAEHILINTCDILPCPQTDKNCQSKTNDLINYLKNNFKTTYYKKENNCEEFIFASP